MEEEASEIDSEIGPLPTFRLAVSHDPVVAPIAVSMLFNLLTRFGINRNVIGGECAFSVEHAAANKWGCE